MLVELQLCGLVAEEVLLRMLLDVPVEPVVPLWLLWLLLEPEGRVWVWLLEPLVCDDPIAGIRSVEAMRIVVSFGYFMCWWFLLGPTTAGHRAPGDECTIAVTAGR